ncbi:MAG TPA: hypothetical protein ENI96_13670 [Sedimenticola thiotaurini]|uniref:Thiol:disulfide interchange protein DsbD N-terminal domain-containing protein n=1 Tax=Sedimenticola thiotaurini TaxID=1543721 RepID=A0A831RQM4_9GAMM|nr:hypothetical protein [Sedimenticola thiotaurini]
MRPKPIPRLLLPLLLAPVLAWAGQVEILDVQARPGGAGRYRFDVTLRHADSGWDHYADKWQVLGPDDRVLGERILLHPHVDEQPFTRSLGGVAVPDGIPAVRIRAHDSVHGWARRQYRVELPR